MTQTYIKDKWRDEKETCNLCARLAKKYSFPIYVHRWGKTGKYWFDEQCDVAIMLGVDREDLYLNVINLENLFRSYQPALERIRA